jgi:hypothetical protein
LGLGKPQSYFITHFWETLQKDTRRHKNPQAREASLLLMLAFFPKPG